MSTPRPRAFCGIAAGTAPATIIREWRDALAFAPLNPAVDGHTLVIPRTHVADAVENPAVTAATMRRAVELAACHGASNILTSVGAAATQSVFHLHIHVVPRRVGDQLMLPWGSIGDPHAPHRCAGMDRLTDEVGMLKSRATRGGVSPPATTTVPRETWLAAGGTSTW